MKLPHPRIVASLALVGALAFLAAAWFGPWDSGAWSDGQHTIDDAAWLRTAGWGAPQPAWAGVPLAPGSRAALSEDGRWMVWAGAGTGETHDLFAGAVRDGRVESFAPLAALCTDADECAPAFGGEWLYFSSDRPGGAGGHDLWRARFSAGVVQAPELVPGPANSAAEELDPAPDPDGGALVFVSDRDERGLDLYTAPLEGGAAARLDALCSAADEREPTFTQGARALVFASSRGGGSGGFDLYRAARFGARYTEPCALAALDTEQDERAPLATRSELGISFLRTEAGANPILLSSPAIELFRAPPRAFSWLEWLALAGLLALAALALLVQRFPELDRIYKCLLVSVIAHLVLLWWFHDVWLTAGKHDEPRHEPLHIRLESRTPRPVVESAPAPASEIAAAPAPVEPPVPAEPPAPAATPASPPLALALPETPSVPDAELAAPERFEPRREASEPAASSASVASAAPELASRPAPEEAELAPERASERAPALRDVASAAHSAAPAPPLELELHEDSGAPSATSRALGLPSRPEHLRSLGSPAASPRAAASVAEAAPEVAASRAPASSAAAAPAGRAASAAVREPARAEQPARSAAPAAALELGELAASENEAAGSSANLAGPTRTSAPSEAHVSRPATAQASGSLARRATQRETDAAPASRESALAPSPQSRSRAADPAELAPETSANVAARAGAAPQLGLESLERAPRDESSPAPAPASGPERAASTASAPRPAPQSRSAGDSLASRPQAPAQSLPRASGGALQDAPQRAEREVALADAPESVARPAAPSGKPGARDWLPEIGASPPLADAPAAQDSGPQRADAPQSAHAAAPAATNGESLARAPQPPKEDAPRPPKSDWDSTPYQNRSGAEKARALKLYGGSERTEAAVARGLAYLARIQHENGAWGDLEAVDEKYGRIAIGKTALCTLAFLGAGHTPDSATEHSGVVARALEFLLSAQDEASGHFGAASAYDHGIATYAVAECFALTHDARLRTALERALAHVLAMQSRRDDDRYRGGWGYYFADGSLYDEWSRTSITAWQVMALESARLSGLAVPDGAFDAARGFLDHAEDGELGAYRYNHDPERLRSAYPTLPASTPAALFALALLGEDISDAHHATAREYVLQRAPDGYRYSGENDFVRLGRGNPYFWYYGTLAMFRLGGAPWQRWNTALQEALLPAQARDGSWPPQDVYARYARDDAGDKSYTTSLCVLSLEVYYRYYLPLLKVR